MIRTAVQQKSAISMKKEIKQTTSWDRDSRRKKWSTSQEQDGVRGILEAQSELQYGPNRFHQKSKPTEAHQQSSTSLDSANKRNQISEEGPAAKKKQTSE